MGSLKPYEVSEKSCNSEFLNNFLSSPQWTHAPALVRSRPRRMRRTGKMVRLSVNVNKIALLRNSRGGALPSVLQAARTCIAAGCHGITVHPRPDARHISTQDVMDLAAMLTVEFNIEGYPSPAFLELVQRVKPAQTTLVPDPP